MRSMPPGSSSSPPANESPYPEAVSLYWVDNVAIMAWREPVTARVADAIFERAEPQRKRYPGGISYVHIGRVEYAMMDGAARRSLARMGRELGNQVISVAVVVRASGFLASTLRSICTGIMVMANQDVELRFHTQPEEVLSWLPAKHEKTGGVKLNVERLRRALSLVAEDN